jgi:hypothetical protein
MDYNDAVAEVLDKAARIKLPGHRLDIVTIVRREFGKHGYCDSKFIDPIEEAVRECIQRWSVIQKRQIWESTETGLQSDVRADAYTVDSIDMDLEGELMFHVMEYLSPDSGHGPTDPDDDDYSA